MFSGFASFLPWSEAKWSTTDPVDIDLEIGDGSQPRMDDDGLSSAGSVRVVDSYPSSIAEVNQEGALPDLPQDELNMDNDISTSGCDAGPSSEESVSAAVPGFLPTIDRPAPTPPETLRVNPPPDSILRQLQDQDHVYSATSSSGSSNHSYARFFHRSRTPKRTMSTRSLGPGGIHSGLSVLSPIYEPPNLDSRDLASTQKEGEAGESSMARTKTHTASIHSTTSVIQERILCLQATHPAFLKRPLKRSLSQTSSSSLHSEVSGAPQLPPLHFRPAFTGIQIGIITPLTPALSPGPPSSCRTSQPPTVVVPVRPSPSLTSPQRSQLSGSQPNTPQSLTVPRSHRRGSLDRPRGCSAIYEDSTSGKSFVTATGGETESGVGVITKHDMPSTVELVIYPQDEERFVRELEHVKELGKDVQEQPSSSNAATSAPEQLRTEQEVQHPQGKRFSESETTFIPDREKRPGTVPASSQRPKGTGTASVMSIASTTVKNESVTAYDGVAEETATIVEDDRFIMERWMKTLFYSASGGRELFSTAKGGERKQYPVSSACVLFWVGFVAPWCWLVGGWMPSRDAPSRRSEVGKKLKEKVSVNVDRETVSHGGEGGGLKKWILPNPSSSFKATAKVPSVSSATTLCSKGVEEARVAVADPWIRRCRIASIVGGAILGLGLIVMVIVLAVVMK